MHNASLDNFNSGLDIAVDSIAVHEVARGVRLAPRSEHAATVHYVLSGTMHLTAAAQTLTCCPGALVIVPPNASREITFDDSAAAACGQQGLLRLVCGMVQPATGLSFDTWDRMGTLIVAEMGAAEFGRQAYALMLEEITNPGLGALALLGALMKSCLVQALRRHDAQSATWRGAGTKIGDPRLDKAIATILGAPGQAHTVASLAGIACMSRAAFAKQFSSRFGVGPMEFVIQIRLRDAAQLLRSTRLSVKEVAAKVGFCSRSHFSHSFRVSNGLDPSAFRAAFANSGSSGTLDTSPAKPQTPAYPHS